jgi:hypothetical protein
MYSSTLLSISSLDAVGWSMPCPGHFNPGKDLVPTGWAQVSFWTGSENLAPTGIRSPDRPARSKLLYRLSYPGPH